MPRLPIFIRLALLASPLLATACAQAYFNEINGVPTYELLEGLKGSRAIGAFAPPIVETPQGVSTAK